VATGGAGADSGSADSLTLLDVCDLAESYLLELLEREVHSQRQAIMTLVAAGATDVEIPDVGAAREEFFMILTKVPRKVDSARADLLETLGMPA
jgi:hypothetical protein